MVNHSTLCRCIAYDYMNILAWSILKKTQILNGCEIFAFKYMYLWYRKFYICRDTARFYEHKKCLSYAPTLQPSQLTVPGHYRLANERCFAGRRMVARREHLTLNAPIATKVVCFYRLLKCLRSLYCKQCGPRSDCSYWSSLFWVHTVCFYT